MLTRRDFIRQSALVGGGLMAFKDLYSISDNKQVNKIIHNVLGRTGVEVSQMGIGCAPFGRGGVTVKHIQDMLTRCIQEGINYLDVAPNYSKGQAEVKLGEALAKSNVRNKFFLVTKTESPTYEGTWELLEQSLERLQTNYVDMVHLHNIGHTTRFPSMDEMLGDNGALAALQEAKKQGKVKFIAASGHLNPSRFHRVIDSGEVDVLMLAVNFIAQHSYNFESKIWLRAVHENMGLVAMKVLGGQEKTIPGKKFRIPDEDYVNAIRYAMTLKGLSSAVIGVETMDELDQAITTFKTSSALTEEEYLALYQKGLDIMVNNERWRAPYGQPIT